MAAIVWEENCASVCPRVNQSNSVCLPAALSQAITLKRFPSHSQVMSVQRHISLIFQQPTKIKCPSSPLLPVYLSALWLAAARSKYTRATCSTSHCISLSKCLVWVRLDLDGLCSSGPSRLRLSLQLFSFYFTGGKNGGGGGYVPVNSWRLYYKIDSFSFLHSLPPAPSSAAPLGFLPVRMTQLLLYYVSEKLLLSTEPRQRRTKRPAN